MKKYLISLFLLAFIIPSITLASWWNPFSWKIIKRSQEIKIEKLTNTPAKPVEVLKSVSSGSSFKNNNLQKK